MNCFGSRAQQRSREERYQTRGFAESTREDLPCPLSFVAC